MATGARRSCAWPYPSTETSRVGTLRNLDRMLLNSPAFAVGWNGFLGAVRNALSLDAKRRELAICAVAVLNRADYELLQHAPAYREAGGTVARLERLVDFEAAMQDATLFSEAECAVLQLTLEMTRNVQVGNACFQRVQRSLGSHQAQVELVGVIAAYKRVSRFLEALQVPPHPRTVQPWWPRSAVSP
jgi:alkylhydroperoxidase family enzyme